MTECACFASALRVSEQLHRTETAIASASFDQILSIARRASAVCCQYAACPLCADTSYFALYVILLRKAASCYNHLVHSVSQGLSPGTASNSSSAGSSHGSYGTTTRLRIGSFEVEAPLDEQTRNAILRTEVRRAGETAALLEAVLGPGSVKAAVARSRDEAALHYQQSLVATLREEIASVERFLHST